VGADRYFVAVMEFGDPNAAMVHIRATAGVFVVDEPALADAPDARMYSGHLRVREHKIVLQPAANGKVATLGRQAEHGKGFVLETVEVSPPHSLAKDATDFDANVGMFPKNQVKPLLA
jgi:hypothetical protein